MSVLLIDRMVAETVMGWTVQLIVGAHDAFEEWRDEQGWRYGSQPKPYSTDIAAAWEVVDALHGRGLYLTLHTGEVVCEAVFIPRVPAELAGATFAVPPLSEAKTAPHAICLAALAAIAAGANETS